MSTVESVGRDDLHTFKNGLKCRRCADHVADVVVETDLIFEIEFSVASLFLNFCEFPVSKRIIHRDRNLVRELRQELDVIGRPHIVRHSRECQRSDGPIFV